MLFSLVVTLNSNRNLDDHRLNVNDNWDDEDNGYAFGMTLALRLQMKTHNNLYDLLHSMGNLTLAWRKAMKGKTSKDYVIEFENEVDRNLLSLHYELKNKTYSPMPMKTFVLRDPKTRVISKSDFRDRVVHHAIVNVLEPIFDKTFIHDSYANRKGKGTIKAIERFDYFVRKVSRNKKVNGWFNNNQIKGYCLKADIRHYFQSVSHEILLQIISRKITDQKVLWLVKQVIKANVSEQRERER